MADRGRSFAAGMVMAMLLFGCVSAQFSYKWYYPNFNSYEGTLLDKTPAGDLDAKVCGIDPVTHEHGCVVMLKPAFQAMYLDYLDTQDKLVACQRGAQ